MNRWVIILGIPLSITYLIWVICFLCSLWDDYIRVNRRCSAIKEKARAARYTLIFPVAPLVHALIHLGVFIVWLVSAAIGERKPKKPKKIYQKELCPSCHKIANKRPMG